MISLFIYSAAAVEFLSQGVRLRKLVWVGLSPTTWAYSKISDFVYIVDLFKVVWDVADREEGRKVKFICQLALIVPIISRSLESL